MDGIELDPPPNIDPSQVEEHIQLVFHLEIVKIAKMQHFQGHGHSQRQILKVLASPDWIKNLIAK